MTTAAPIAWMVGIDEVGTGAWAGPLAVGAAALPVHRIDEVLSRREVRDSKTMRPMLREQQAARLRDEVLWCVVQASAAQINVLGVRGAWDWAVLEAWRRITALVAAQDTGAGTSIRTIIDGAAVPEALQVTRTVEAIPRADRDFRLVSAASILAKVDRDGHMRNLDTTYPGYGFAQHVGYGTERHAVALRELGPCPEHRLNYRPVADVVRQGRDVASASTGLCFVPVDFGCAG